MTSKKPAVADRRRLCASSSPAQISLSFDGLQAIATKVDLDRGAELSLANDSGLGAIGIHAIVIAAVLACQQGAAYTDLAISRSERPL